jgi:cobalt-zinc-cadmium efflux system protein
LRKTTILVSILNAVLLFGAVIAIGWDAFQKFQNPEPVAGDKIMIVAGIGFVINALTALLFVKGQKDDLNIKGAFMHMAADAGVSLGVVIAGLLINLTGKLWIDPLMSFIIIAVILWGTWKLFMDSVNLALDAVPKHVDLEKVRNYIEAKNGVEGLHDLHIWAMSTTQIALTAHLEMPRGGDDQFIAKLQKELKNKFGIGHTTFQIEKRNIDVNCETDC